MKLKKVFYKATLSVVAVAVVLGYKIAVNENRRSKVVMQVKSWLGVNDSICR